MTSSPASTSSRTGSIVRTRMISPTSLNALRSCGNWRPSTPTGTTSCMILRPEEVGKRSGGRSPRSPSSRQTNPRGRRRRPPWASPDVPQGAALLPQNRATLSHRSGHLLHPGWRSPGPRIRPEADLKPGLGEVKPLNQPLWAGSASASEAESAASEAKIERNSRQVGSSPAGSSRSAPRRSLLPVTCVSFQFGLANPAVTLRLYARLVGAAEHAEASRARMQAAYGSLVGGDEVAGRCRSRAGASIGVMARRQRGTTTGRGTPRPGRAGLSPSARRWQLRQRLQPIEVAAAPRQRW